MTDKVSLLPALQIETPNDALQAQFIQIQQKLGDRTAAPDKETGLKPSDHPKVDVGDKVFNSALNVAIDVGDGYKDAQAAAKAFMQVPDKKEALEKGAPAFEAAIKKSDSEYISAIAKYSPDYNVKRHAVEGAQMKAVMDIQGLKAVLSGIPDEKQQEVEALANLTLGDDISPALRASIHKELEQFPGLNKSLDTVRNSIQAEEKAMTAMTDAAKPLLQAAYEQAGSRYIYARAMELAGDKGKAYLMKEEGKDKINDAYFEYLDKPKPPKPLLQA